MQYRCKSMFYAIQFAEMKQFHFLRSQETFARNVFLHSSLSLLVFFPCQVIWSRWTESSCKATISSWMRVR